MKNKIAAKKQAALISAQKHLFISEIKQDTVVLKDGTLRAVLMVSSLNFSLKNEDEQTAIVGGYVSFLNSIDHPLQILIQSRELYIKPYLDSLIKSEHEQTNELLRAQIADYRSFVAELVDLGNITSKQFYVVVPYDPLSNQKRSFWSRAQEVFNPIGAVKLKEEKFLQRKYDLDQRTRQVESGLSGLGLEVIRLDTQSLIELYFSSYNPDIALSEHLPDLNKIQVEAE